METSYSRRKLEAETLVERVGRYTGSVPEDGSRFDVVSAPKGESSLGRYKVCVPEGESNDWKVEKFHQTFFWSEHEHYGRSVPPGDYTRLIFRDEVIMSDSPVEIRDHLEFIKKAHGRCLINGLGLGMVLQAVRNKRTVTHIDVVEKSPDVIRLVWPTYASLPDVTLHEADAYTMRWPRGTKWDCAWHDIWGHGDAEGRAKLKHKYAGRVQWQGAWASRRSPSPSRRKPRKEA